MKCRLWVFPTMKKLNSFLVFWRMLMTEIKILMEIFFWWNCWWDVTEIKNLKENCWWNRSKNLQMIGSKLLTWLIAETKESKNELVKTLYFIICLANKQAIVCQSMSTFQVHAGRNTNVPPVRGYLFHTIPFLIYVNDGIAGWHFVKRICWLELQTRCWSHWQNLSQGMHAYYISSSSSFLKTWYWRGKTLGSFCSISL